MVVVVSDDYLQSKECDFQTKFALSLSPGKLRPTLFREGKGGIAFKIPDQACRTDLNGPACQISEWLYL